MFLTPAARAQYGVTYTQSTGAGISLNGAAATPYVTPWGSPPWAGGCGGGQTGSAPLGPPPPPGPDAVSPQAASCRAASPQAARAPRLTVHPSVTSPGGGSVQADGTITATVALPDGATAPDAVLVEEYCVVSWFGSGAMGICTNPLGGAPVANGSGGQTQTLTKYTFIDHPGATLGPYSCAPQAEADYPAGSSGGVGVEYRVTVTPVSISLGGVNTDDPNNIKALTGQKITALLLGLPAGAVVSSYTWTVGGDAFKTYNENAVSNQLVRLTAADLTGPPAGQTGMGGVAFYDKTAESLTVTCSATFSVPNGNSAPVNASSKQITVLKPTASWVVDTGVDPHVYNHPSNKNFGSNVVWKLNITVPPPFSGGIGGIGQIVTTHRTNVLDPGNGTPQVTYTTKDPGPGLDKDFPYPFGFPLDANGDPDDANPIRTKYTWPVTSTGYSGDQPSQPYLGTDAQYSDDKWVKSTASDSFDTYLMYQPAAVGSVWVPLQVIHWDWKGTVTITAQATPLSETGFHSSQTGTNTNDPPQWSEIVSGTATQRPSP